MVRKFLVKQLISREKDMDEVLQTYAVFSSVFKGKLAEMHDLMAGFETYNTQDICEIVRIYWNSSHMRNKP